MLGHAEVVVVVFLLMLLGTVIYVVGEQDVEMGIGGEGTVALPLGG